MLVLIFLCLTPQPDLGEQSCQNPHPTTEADRYPRLFEVFLYRSQTYPQEVLVLLWVSG